MYGCESWTIKKAEHRRIDAFDLWCCRRLLSHLDSKEIKPVNPKRNQSWIFIGRTDAEAEAPILWPSDVKCWLFGKDPYAGKDWGQEKKGMTEDEMVGWHHWLMDLNLSRLQKTVMDREAGMLRYTGSQTVRRDLATELNWTWNTIIGMLVYWIWQWRKRVKDNSRFLNWNLGGWWWHVTDIRINRREMGREWVNQEFAACFR